MKQIDSRILGIDRTLILVIKLVVTDKEDEFYLGHTATDNRPIKIIIKISSYLFNQFHPCIHHKRRFLRQAFVKKISGHLSDQCHPCIHHKKRLSQIYTATALAHKEYNAIGQTGWPPCCRPTARHWQWHPPVPSIFCRAAGF